jgi:hypothetical protein
MRIPDSFLLVSLTAISFGIAGCSKTQSVSAASPQDANGNLAPAGEYDQPPPANYQQYPPPANAPAYNDANYDQTYAYDDAADDGAPAVYASEPPPQLPEYAQPPCPGDNYIWTPGYWAWTDTGYYWVPGAWILAPYVDALWTPPWWEFYSGRYRWHRGYWGTHIGFYGGIDYGFGYTGRGYYGGYWDRGRFSYNRAVTNVNVTVVHNVYQRPVNNVTVNRISYNGGPRGIQARPIAAETQALRERRTAPVAAQIQHARSAEQNRQQFASVNRGRPALVAQNNALATPYRAPAARPTGPELPRRTAQNVGPREQSRPNAAAPPAQNTPSQNGRPFAQRGAPSPVPAQAQPPVEQRRERPDVNRPNGNRPEFGRQNTEPRPAAPPAQPQAQPAPQARPQFERRGPQATPQPAPQAQPQPQPRQAPQVREAPPGRPQQFERPQARPEAQRPQPQARPAEQPRPQQQARPEGAGRPSAPPQEHGRGDGKGRHD